MQNIFPPGHFVRNKHFVVILACAFIVLGFLLLVTIRGVQDLHLSASVIPHRIDKIDDPLHAAPPHRMPVPGVGPVVGLPTAPVTVVEFTDYECPLCARYFTEAYEQIRKQYITPGLVKYEIRNFPLSTVHPRAILAAEVALCAGEQNAFEGMHDLLFQRQEEWTNTQDLSVVFRSFAVALGINVPSFNACVTSHQTAGRIQRDRSDATDAGINGTPSFWVYGPDGSVRQINGAYSFSRYKAVFDGFLPNIPIQ